MKTSPKADELLLIDAGVEDAAALAHSARAGIEVVQLGAGAEAQICEALRTRSLKAVHFVSHGAPGSLELGGRWLDTQSLYSAQPVLKSLRASLSPGQGELLLYGCDVATGEKGSHFIRELSENLGVTVRASDNKTGFADLGGDWNLEASTGGARSALAFTETSGYRHVLPKPVVETYQFNLFVRPGEPSYTWTIGLYTDGNGNTVQPTQVSYGHVTDPVVIPPWILNRGVFQYSTNNGNTWNNMTVNDSRVTPLVYYPIVGSIFRFVDQSPLDTADDHVGHYMLAPPPVHSIGGSGTVIHADTPPTDITSDKATILNDRTQGTTIAALTPVDVGLTLGGHWVIDSQSVPNLFTLTYDNTVNNLATLKLGSGTMPAGGQTATVTVRYYDPYDTDSAGAAIPGEGFSKQLSYTVINNATQDLNFDNEAVVNTYTPGYHQMPVVATLTDGNYVVVWQSAGQGKTDANFAGVYARIYNAQGVPQGAPFVISNASAASDERQPAVLALPNERFAVAYNVLKAQTPDPLYDVVVRLVEANGTVGSPVLVNTEEGNFYFPGLGKLADGSLLVAYGDLATGDGYSQNISATDGSKIGSETLLAAEDVYLPSAALLDNGSPVVAWTSYFDGVVRFKINNGTTVDTGLSNSYAVPPRLLPLTGGFLLITDEADATSGNMTIKAQRYTNAGVAQGSPVVLPADTSFYAVSPNAIQLSDGSLLFAWESTGDLFGAGIFGRRFDVNLNPLDVSDFQINEYRENDQYYVALAPLAGRLFAAAWMENSVVRNDIETRVLMPGGSPPVVIPTLATLPTSASITAGTATLGGEVTATGGADVTVRGVVYSLTSVNANPQIGGAGVTELTETGTFGTGSFTRSAASLTAGTSYSFKAYAKNIAGTSYSIAGTFTTDAAADPGPTLLAAGDLAFTGYNSESTTDSFCFMLLKDIGTGTIIYFTDKGWDDTTGFDSDETVISWISGGPMTAGTQVVLTRGASDWAASSGSAAHFSGTQNPMDFASSGDQVFAFQGTVGTPVFISGLHMEFVPGTTAAADWDGAGSAAASTSRTALPDTLTNGTNAVALLLDGTEYDNAIYNGPVTGTVSDLRSSINNRANWLFNDTTVYPLPPPLPAAVAPTLTATPTSATVTHNTATLGGNVTATGGADVTARGVVYALTSANANPEIGGANVTVLTETGTFGTGSFTRSATSLAASSGYSFKAYATNSAGTSYSSAGTFTTSVAPATAPTLTATPTSTGVTAGGATLGGNVTATGGADVTARGVVYALTSANANPEIGGANVTVLTETGTFGTGSFTRSAASLAASSGYSFKAYATNSAGTSYSSVGTFTTSALAPVVVIQPTSVIAHPPLFNANYTAETSINQAGLTVGYTSGVTTLTSYVAQDPRQGFPSSLPEGFTSTANNNVPCNWDYDLGAVYDLEKFLLWNTQNDLSTHVTTFEIFVDDNSGFTSPTSVGTFTAFTTNPGSSDYPTPLEVFTLTPATSRYVRFRILTTDDTTNMRAIFGEVALAGKTSSSGPSPSVAVSSLARNSAANTNQTSVNWTLSFGSAVTNVTASNFSLTGTGTSGASVGTPTTANGGTTWTVPVTTGADGTLTLNLANATGLSATISTTLPYAGHTYTVDKTAPDTTITANPANPTNSTAASFTFSGTDAGSGVASYEVKLDGGSFAADTSPKSYSGLSEGSHTFQVRAIDAAGNEEPTPASFTWVVDLTPPVVQSVTRLNPAGQNVAVNTVVFRVTYSEPVTLNAPETARYTVVPVNGSSITADVTSVSGSGATRDVTVTITGGAGEFRLRVLN